MSPRGGDRRMPVGRLHRLADLVDEGGYCVWRWRHEHGLSAAVVGYPRCAGPKSTGTHREIARGDPVLNPYDKLAIPEQRAVVGPALHVLHCVPVAANQGLVLLGDRLRRIAGEDLERVVDGYWHTLHAGRCRDRLGLERTAQPPLPAVGQYPLVEPLRPHVEFDGERREGAVIEWQK